MPAGADGNLKLGDSDIDKLYLGDSEVDKVYYGADEVWTRIEEVFFLIDRSGTDRIRSFDVDFNEVTPITRNLGTINGLQARSMFIYQERAYVLFAVGVGSAGQGGTVAVWDLNNWTRQSSMDISLGGAPARWYGIGEHNGNLLVLQERQSPLPDRVRFYRISDGAYQSGMDFMSGVSNRFTRGFYAYNGIGYIQDQDQYTQRHQISPHNYLGRTGRGGLLRGGFGYDGKVYNINANQDNLHVYNESPFTYIESIDLPDGGYGGGAAKIL